MIILNRDGTLDWQCVEGRQDDQRAASIELPAALVSRQPSLFDRVFALAFDVLGLFTIELRITATASEAAGEHSLLNGQE